MPNDLDWVFGLITVRTFNITHSSKVGTEFILIGRRLVFIQHSAPITQSSPNQRIHSRIRYCFSPLAFHLSQWLSVCTHSSWVHNCFLIPNNSFRYLSMSFSKLNFSPQRISPCNRNISVVSFSLASRLFALSKSTSNTFC